MRKLLAIMAIGTMCYGSAHAGPVGLDSSIFVERVEGEGRNALRRLEIADTFSPGDRIVTILRWQAVYNDRDGFMVTSAMPAQLRFNRASGDVSVSTDGGNSFHDADNFSGRITHLRWQISAGEAERGRGQLSYRATVR